MVRCSRSVDNEGSILGLWIRNGRVVLLLSIESPLHIHSISGSSFISCSNTSIRNSASRTQAGRVCHEFLCLGLEGVEVVLSSVFVEQDHCGGMGGEEFEELG